MEKESSASLTRFDRRLLVALLALTLVLFAPFLIPRNTPLIMPSNDLGTDFPREVWPLASLVTETIGEHGVLPLWRSYLLSGAPLVGHPVAAVFYPPNWITLVLPLPLALNLIAALHIWWMGVGTYLVLRWQEDVSPIAAFLGALLFAQGPKWFAHLSGGHWFLLSAVAWWPWAWLAFSQYWHDRKGIWPVILGVALAAQAVNHAHVVAMTLLWLAGASLLVLRGRSLGEWVRRAGALWVPVGVLSLGLAAIQVLPTLEMLPHTTRANLVGADASFGSLPPALLIGAIVPTELEFPEWYLYPGIATVALVMMGWARGWTARDRTWAAAGLIGLLLALGPALPVYAWAVEHVPGMSLFRVSARWWVFALFALAVLAARAVDRWRRSSDKLGKRFWVPVAVLGAVYLGGWALNAALGSAIPLRFMPHIGALLAATLLLTRRPTGPALALLALVLTTDLWWAAYELVRPMPVDEMLSDEEGLITYLRDTLNAGERSFSPYQTLPQAALVRYGLEAADGYDPYPIATYAAFVERAIGCATAYYAVSVPAMQTSPEAADECATIRPRWDWLALLNVRALLLPDEHALPDRAVDAHFPGDATGGGWRVYDLGAGLGRAFGVEEAWPVRDSRQCLDQLEAIDIRATAIVETDLHFEPVQAPPVVVGRTVRPNQETFTVESEQGGLLVRSMAWAPDWRVTVDSRPADLLRVDCALQGVWLEPGAKTVRFEYAPRGFLVGRWISLFAAVVLLAAGCLRLERAVRAER